MRLSFPRPRLQPFLTFSYSSVNSLDHHRHAHVGPHQRRRQRVDHDARVSVGRARRAQGEQQRRRAERKDLGHHRRRCRGASSSSSSSLSVDARTQADSSPAFARSQGIAVLAALLYVGYRLTQRRFSNLDADGDDIRWPELQPDGGGNLATLNPQGTRRTGGAGFAMEKDDDESDDEDGDELDRKGAAATGGEWAAAEGSPRVGAGVGAGAGGHYGMGHNASETAFFEGQGGHSPYEQYEGAYGQPHSPRQSSYCASPSPSPSLALSFSSFLLWHSLRCTN